MQVDVASLWWYQAPAVANYHNYCFKGYRSVVRPECPDKFSKSFGKIFAVGFSVVEHSWQFLKTVFFLSEQYEMVSLEAEVCSLQGWTTGQEGNISVF